MAKTVKKQELALCTFVNDIKIVGADVSIVATYNTYTTRQFIIQESSQLSNSPHFNQSTFATLQYLSRTLTVRSVSAMCFSSSSLHPDVHFFDNTVRTVTASLSVLIYAAVMIIYRAGRRKMVIENGLDIRSWTSVKRQCTVPD